MKWWLNWLSLLGMSYLPGGRSLHRLMQDRLGEHRYLESSSRFDNAELFLRKTLRLTERIDAPLIVEIGTGWVPAVPLSLLLAGLRIETYDVTRHVDTTLYQRTRDVLSGRCGRLADAAGIPEPAVRARLDAIRDIDDFASACDVLGGRYAAPVDTTALSYRDGDADVLISNLVLQCIPQSVLPAVLKESFRVLKPGGHAVHRIWMADEYAGRDPDRNRLHYLTYSQRTWTRWFCHRLKYLNRLRAPQFLELLEEIGFEVRHCERGIDEQSIPYLKQLRLDEPFRGMSWEDLATTSLEVVVRNPQSVESPLVTRVAQKL